MSKSAPLPKILLVGKPNSGKTLLFNRLTGLNQKVANFPGVTVEVKSGISDGFELLDLPGIYSLQPISQDERVAIEQFQYASRDETCVAVVCVLDATRLERSLALGLELAAATRALKVPFIFVLNMADEIGKLGLKIDTQGLSNELGHELLLVSARTKHGIPELKARLQKALNREMPRNSAQENPASIKEDFPIRAKDLAARFAPSPTLLLKRQARIDRYALHNSLGLVFFILSMAIMFQAVFTWAGPLMDFTEAVLTQVGEKAATLMPTTVLGDFVKDGLLGGISAVLVFVPQIALLFLMIGLLEDSGYLARAAMLCHRPLSFFGLSGRSFVPLLSGHACAIPAIMASRTIESPRARWLTLMAIPLMSCSARLPVYGLLIAAVIPDVHYLGGVFGLQGLSLLLLYLFGIFSGLFVTSVVDRLADRQRQQSIPFILELPPYRMPSWKPLVIRSANSSWQFVNRAGSTVFAVSVIVWFLGYFPNGSGHLETSYLAALGKFVAPLFAPLGLDWKITVAVLSSFLAREVFVGTLGVIAGADQSGMTLASGIALMIFFAISMQCVSTLAVLRKETGSFKMPLTIFFAYTATAYLLAASAHRLIEIIR